ncbi:MAG: hypothetical protein E7190_10490 [Erysipelotrichaceae bacterium]|nr:hypothetical protein [Erysipelotrichaceae bacterium]
MNKNYFRYLLKERRVALVFTFVLYLAIANSIFLFSDANRSGLLRDAVLAGTVMSFMMTYLLPVLLLSPVHRRRSADLYLSLPISRKEMLVTSLVFAAAFPAVCFAASSLISLILSRVFAYAGKVLLIILFITAVMIEMTLINSALFLLANNIFDGIVMICSYTGIPLLILMTVTGFIDTMVAGAGIGTYPFVTQAVAWTSPLAMNIMAADDVLSLLSSRPADVWRIMYFILPTVYALAAVILLKKHFIDRKSERAEQISDDILSYPGVIHICLFLSMMFLSFETPRSGILPFVIFYLILLFIYIAAMFVYKRSMKISWKNLAIYAAVMGFCLGFCHIAWNTRCFGLAENYALNQDRRLCYEYSVSADINNLGTPGNMKDYEDSADIYFAVNIPTDDMDSYQEIIALMENYRHEGIDEYYRNENNHTGNEAYFSVSNHSEMSNEPELIEGYGYVYRDQESNHYGYSISRLLSEEELKTVSKYVEVTVFDHVSGDSHPLDEYLERRNH